MKTTDTMTKKSRMEFSSRMYMIAAVCWTIAGILELSTGGFALSYIGLACAMFALSLLMKEKAKKLEDES